MNVLHLHEKTAIHGGAEVYINQLQELLPNYNCETHWIGINESTGEYWVTAYESSAIIKLKGLKEVFKYLQDYIEEKRIDIINIHNIFNPAIVSFCLKASPVVKSVHSPVMVCPGKDKFWRYSEEPCTIRYGLHCFKHIYTEGCANRHPKRVLKAWNYVNFELHKAVKKYKQIIVMSDFMRKGLLECGIEDSKIICNPYFTNEIDHTENPVQSNPTVKEILFIGRLVTSKGPHIMLAALAPLLQERNDVRIRVIGDGIMKEELLKMAIQLKIEGKVLLSGWLSKNEIDKAIGKCYIVVFPSIYPEAFGIVGIEAMMQGKPVIGFDVGGVSTWLKNNETGFLIENKNLALLYEKTLELITQTDLYKKMSRKARQHALKRYIPSVHINNLLTIYSTAINN
ncbi:MAG: glycosyltransferase family 4 protein [Agriterribacter sp.]